MPSLQGHGQGETTGAPHRDGSCTGTVVVVSVVSCTWFGPVETTTDWDVESAP